MNNTTTEPKCDNCGSSRDLQPETFYFTMSTNDGGTFQEAETQDLCGRCRGTAADDEMIAHVRSPPSRPTRPSMDNWSFRKTGTPSSLCGHPITSYDVTLSDARVKNTKAREWLTENVCADCLRLAIEEV